MLLFDFICLCIVLVFAHLSDSQFIILQDYDDEAYVFNRGVIEPKREAISISPFYRPKKAILEFVRHFDKFEDQKEIRAKTTKRKEALKDDPISYVDVKKCIPTVSAKGSVDHHPQDLLILSEAPLQLCNGEDCVKDRTSIRTNDDHKDKKHRKRYFKKRFAIVHNRHQSLEKPGQFDSSEEYNYEKKKSSKKKQNDSPETMDSNSEERSIESWEASKKKKYSSEESRSREYIKKPSKKYRSIEDGSKESNSIEDVSKESSSFEYLNKIKKTKKHVSSDETESKTMDLKDYYFMQGNQIFSANDWKKKKSFIDVTSRKRLQQFLPKRYHWEPEEIHDLGYFWFNGPKGLYPAPRPL